MGNTDTIKNTADGLLLSCESHALLARLLDCVGEVVDDILWIFDAD
jgi:hypothetical protein